MADKNKPRINITRGKRDRPSSTSSTSDASSSASADSPSAWLAPSRWIECSDQVANSVRDVWLAGLGAIAVVEEQGTKLFESLVEEGKAWEQERREEAVRAYKEMEDRVKEQAEMSTETDASMEAQIAKRVRDGVDAALERAGMPSQRALDELRDQVDALAAKADRLAQSLEEQESRGG